MNPGSRFRSAWLASQAERERLSLCAYDVQSERRLASAIKAEAEDNYRIGVHPDVLARLASQALARSEWLANLQSMGAPLRGTPEDDTPRGTPRRGTPILPLPVAPRVQREGKRTFASVVAELERSHAEACAKGDARDNAHVLYKLPLRERDTEQVSHEDETVPHWRRPRARRKVRRLPPA